MKTTPENKERLPLTKDLRKELMTKLQFKQVTADNKIAREWTVWRLITEFLISRLITK